MNGNATQTVLNQLYILKQKCATSYTVLQFCHEYIQVTQKKYFLDQSNSSLGHNALVNIPSANYALFIQPLKQIQCIASALVIIPGANYSPFSQHLKQAQWNMSAKISLAKVHSAVTSSGLGHLDMVSGLDMQTFPMLSYSCTQ